MNYLQKEIKVYKDHISYLEENLNFDNEEIYKLNKRIDSRNQEKERKIQKDIETQK